MIMILKDLATITECTEILGCKRGTLRAAIAKGYIDVKYTKGGTTLVLIKSAKKWFKADRVAGRKFGS